MDAGVCAAGGANEALAHAMAAIHGAAFPVLERWDARAMLELLALPGVHGLIDPAGGCLLARFVADEAEILTIAVQPEQRRQGIGRGLLKQVMTAATRAGARTLFLEVSLGNGAALALYAAAGFVECGRRVGYYPDGSDALVLRRTLAEG